MESSDIHSLLSGTKEFGLRMYSIKTFDGQSPDVLEKAFGYERASVSCTDEEYDTLLGFPCEIFSNGTKVTFSNSALSVHADSYQKFIEGMLEGIQSDWFKNLKFDSGAATS